MKIERDSIDTLDWSKADGLVPAIVQHVDDGRVLMLGYMNRAALEQTLRKQMVTFYSRSKQRLWTKGENSGNSLVLQAVHADCDADALLVLAEPRGPTCHLGTASCFGTDATAGLAFLGELDALVAERKRTLPSGSYSSELFHAGTARIAQKVGEEAVETVLAAVAGSDDELLGESADLLFHLLVLLRARELSLADVSKCLQARSQPRNS